MGIMGRPSGEGSFGFFVNTLICVDLRSEKYLSDKLNPENTIDTKNYVRELSTEEI